MVTFSTPRLLEKGIATVHMDLELDTSKISSLVKDTLERHQFGPKDAQPFIVTLNAYDLSNKWIAVLGTAEGVHHKTPLSLVLDETYGNCRQPLYLNMLFVEREYEKCGIASSVLEHMPELINGEMGASIDAIILAPVPQYRNAEGRIVQLPFGMEFLIKYKELVHFYSNRKFTFCDSIGYMGRWIA